LLNAGLSLAEIANHMGWSVRYAANMIERYARVSPDETDAVMVKLETAKKGENMNKTVNAPVNGVGRVISENS